MNLPSVDNLRCFEAATKASSFRTAAKAVALTPTAFGQRIKQLEDQLGVQLFHRTTRTMQLTEAGLSLVPRVKEALEALERCAAVNQQGQPLPMELTLGTRYELGLSYLMPLTEQLQREYPFLTLHYFFGGSGGELHQRVKEREIDFCFSSHRITDPLLDGIRVHQEDYVFVGAPGLLKRNPLEKDEQAQNHVLVDINAALPLFGYWRDSPQGGDRLSFKNVLKAGSIEPMRRLVLEEKGVAVLPKYFVKEDLKEGRLELVLPDVESLFDYFRVVFRRDDPRKTLFTSLAAFYSGSPLR